MSLLDEPGEVRGRGQARPVALLGALVHRLWPTHPRRWRDVPGRLRPSLAHIARLTTASVIAYLLTVAFTEGNLDLTGALTALLVVQASGVSTLKMGMVRVGAVLTGVTVAVVVSSWWGLAWWTLGLAVAASLLLAKILHLGDQSLETPISAMLLLQAHGHEIAVETRILTTFIGAGVGIAFTLLLPPSVPERPAATAVRRVSATICEALRDAEESIATQPITAERAEEWMGQARAATAQIAAADAAIDHLVDARRLNARAIGRADLAPRLREGLATLELVALGVRSLFGVIRAEAPDAGDGLRDDSYGEDVRAAFAVVLSDVAASVEAYAVVVDAQVTGESPQTEELLAENVEILKETQAILTELMFVDARADTSLWMLRGSILAAVENILGQLERGMRFQLQGQR